MPLKREGEMILSTLMLLTHLHLQCFLFVHSVVSCLVLVLFCLIVLTFDPVLWELTLSTSLDLSSIDHNILSSIFITVTTHAQNNSEIIINGSIITQTVDVT